jgi:hypothetical protein
MECINGSIQNWLLKVLEELPHIASRMKILFRGVMDRWNLMDSVPDIDESPENSSDFG